MTMHGLVLRCGQTWLASEGRKRLECKVVEAEGGSRAKRSKRRMQRPSDVMRRLRYFFGAVLFYDYVSFTEGIFICILCQKVPFLKWDSAGRKGTEGGGGKEGEGNGLSSKNVFFEVFWTNNRETNAESDCDTNRCARE